MKRLILLFVLGMSTVASAEIFRWESVYVNGFAGVNRVHTNRGRFYPGIVVGGSVGYVFPFGMRLEAEGSYRYNRFKSFCHHEVCSKLKGNFSQAAVMANGIYDIDLNSWLPYCLYRFAPYLGGGIGYAYQKKTRTFSEDEHGRYKGFAWQVIAGIAYQFTCAFDAALEYRNFQGQDKDHASTMVGISARYFF